MSGTIQITLNYETLQITRNQEVIVNIYSQVPNPENISRFDRLTKIVLNEWYKKCADIIKNIIENEMI